MKIFISYSTPDYDIAKRFADALRAKRPTFSAYFAPQRNKASAYWMPILGEELKSADVVLLLVGRRVGPWQELEYYEALRLWKQSSRPAIAPVIIADTVPGLHFLHHFHALMLDHGAFSLTVDAVVDAFDGVSSPAQAAAWRVTNPYRGLNAMGPSDAAFFFGREELTASILDMIRVNRKKVLTLVGNSGVGKSSVARAGVLGSLRSQLWPGDLDRAWPTALAESASWIAIEFVPGERPVQALARSLTDLWLESPAESLKEALGWADLFETGKAGLRDLALDAARKIGERDNAPAPSRFVLYVDQGEELYSRALPAEARLFSRLIADAAGHPEFVVMTSLRADWYGSLQADEALFPASVRIDVPPLSRAQIDEVVRKPAARLGVRFDNPSVVPLIAEATAREPGSLPMLSFLMEDAWKAMQADEASGGALRFPFDIVDVSRPLADRAENFFSAHPDDHDAIRRLFTLRLAQVPTDGKPVRRRARRGECGPTEWALASELTAQEWRLLASGDDAGGPFIEVAHEKLLENWPRLTAWIDDERGFLAAKAQLEVARREWAASDETERDDALLMGLALDRARRWLADGRAEDLGPEDCAFIEASIKQDNARKLAAEKRRRLVLGGSIAASIALAAFASFAGYQWFEADAARIAADEQRDRAQQSYTAALDATDTFLTALTSNFADSAAFPPDQIKPILASGEAFLTNMEARIGASSELQAVRAKVLTQFAEITLDDDMASARQQLAAAREALALLPPGDPATRLREAGILVLEAEIAIREQRYEDALALADSAVAAATAGPIATGDEKLVLADAYRAKGNAEWRLRRYADGAATSDLCLALFLDEASKESNNLLFAKVKCLHVKAISIGEGKIGDFVDQAGALYQSETDLLKELIAREPTNVSYRITLARVINNLSTFGEAGTKKELSLSRRQEARQVAREARDIAPWSTEAADFMAHTSHWTAQTMVQLDQRQDAFDAYGEAAEILKLLVSKDPANIDWRNRYQSTLYSVIQNVVNIGKEELSSHQLDFSIDAMREHLRLLESPTEAELGNDYAKWQHLETEFRLAEALAWNGRILEAADAYQAVIDATKDAVGVDAEEKRSRYWAAWAHWNYPKCEHFHDLQIPLEVKILNCQTSIALREAYLAKENHWRVRAVIAQNRHVLGKLLFEAGRNQEALAHVEFAVSRDVEAAIRTLHDWYLNGTGPVAADPAKAAELAERLSSEYFDLKRFTVQSLSWDGVTEIPLYFLIGNATAYEPNPIEAELHRLETIEGFDVPSNAEDAFQRIFNISKANSVNLTNVSVYLLNKTVEHPKNGIELEATAFSSLKARNYLRLLEITTPFLATDAGRATLAAVLAELAKKPAKDPVINPAGIHYLAENWEDILAAGGHELAVHAATALMSQASTLGDRTEWLYRRGLARNRGSDFAGAINDFSTVVVSYPQSSSALNSLAYAYLQSGTEYDRALDIAERAHGIEPDNIFIKDTLGLAQIRSGSIEDGIKTLSEVVAADGTLPDPWAHLAEGYRLSGRFSEARDAIRRARETAKDERLIVYLDQQEKLNNDNEKAASVD